MVCSPHGPLLAGWPQERGASPRKIGVLCVCRDWDGGLGALRLFQLTFFSWEMWSRVKR